MPYPSGEISLGGVIMEENISKDALSCYQPHQQWFQYIANTSQSLKFFHDTKKALDDDDTTYKIFWNSVSYDLYNINKDYNLSRTEDSNLFCPHIITLKLTKANKKK